VPSPFGDCWAPRGRPRIAGSPSRRSVTSRSSSLPSPRWPACAREPGETRARLRESTDLGKDHLDARRQANRPPGSPRPRHCRRAATLNGTVTWPPRETETSQVPARAAQRPLTGLELHQLGHGGPPRSSRQPQADDWGSNHVPRLLAIQGDEPGRLVVSQVGWAARAGVRDEGSLVPVLALLGARTVRS
jgi:hypothetical protein